MATRAPSSFLIGRKSLLVLIVPSMIFYSIFFVYPIIMNVMLAFTNRSMYHFYDYDFVGPANFMEMLSSADFYTVMARTFFWVVCTVSLQIICAVFFAVFFTSPRLKGRSVYRGLMLLPWAFPNVVMILVWRGMFNPSFGVINVVVGTKIDWYNSSEYAFLMTQIVNIWLAYPFLMLLLTGAIQSIPTELSELAEMFGCSASQKLRFITLPLVKPILSYGTLLTSGTAFTQFPVIWLLTRGGPATSTDIVMTWAYKEAFYSQRFGYHAAIAIFASLISLIFALIVIKRGGVLEGIR